jgi:hypothetical protein
MRLPNSPEIPFNLEIKNKSQWFPATVEFVGVDIFAKGGNTPAKSKDIIHTNWNEPDTPRKVLGFIGFAIF